MVDLVRKKKTKLVIGFDKKKYNEENRMREQEKRFKQGAKKWDNEKNDEQEQRENQNEKVKSRQRRNESD